MIPCQRHLFDMPEGITYLNCAYMSPLMHAAAASGRVGLDAKMHPWEIVAADFFSQADRLRIAAARLLHCAGDDVAIISSASYGLASAAANLPVARGQKILVLAEQFPSNLYPWRRLTRDKGAEVVTVPWPEDGDWTSAVLRELTKDVAIAALPQVQWTSGGLLDLAAIAELCRKNGTRLALDLTQSLGVYPFDAATVRPDFAVAATYKWLMGPYSLGVMYVAPEWQRGRPLEEAWIQRGNAARFSELVNYSEDFQAGARRFDMGEHSNFALLPVAIQAIEQLLAWGVPEISETIGALNRQLAEKVDALGMRALPDALRAPHYLCLRCQGQLPAGLVDALAKERVFVSLRGSSVRVTPHLYNSPQDMDRLLHLLKERMPGGRG